MERLIDLKQFDLNPEQNDAGQFEFNLNLVLNVYMLQDDTAEGEEA